jgi:hypothetical protein
MDSIVTQYEGICAITGKRATCKHHLVFGRGFRELAEEDGLWIPLIDEVHDMGKYAIHDNPTAEALSKMCGQLAFEKYWVAKGDTEDEARERFRKRYGRSYL